MKIIGGTIGSVRYGKRGRIFFGEIIAESGRDHRWAVGRAMLVLDIILPLRGVREQSS